jgi:hypothetical protein
MLAQPAKKAAPRRITKQKIGSNFIVDGQRPQVTFQIMDQKHKSYQPRTKSEVSASEWDLTEKREIRHARSGDGSSPRFVVEAASWERLVRTTARVLPQKRIPRLSSVFSLEKLRFIPHILRDRPAISIIHKIQLDNPFTVSQVTLQTLFHFDGFPCPAPVIGSIQRTLCRLG